MQIHLLKILAILAFLIWPNSARAQTESLRKADSLFKAKQYTQSFDNYHLILLEKKYTPSMLLKMAYIQEGLGHVSQSLHYLQTYYRVTGDESALKKIEALAEKNKLDGYTQEKFSVQGLLASYRVQTMAITAGLIALCLFSGWATRKKGGTPTGALLVSSLLLFLLVGQANFLEAPQQGIVRQSSTYLMSGPSAGASVMAIIDEGHQLRILGQRDIWLEVEWQNRIAYIKEDKLLTPEF